MALMRANRVEIIEIEQVQTLIATIELLQIVQPVHHLHQRKLQALSLGTLHIILLPHPTASGPSSAGPSPA